MFVFSRRYRFLSMPGLLQAVLYSRVGGVYQTL